MLTYIYKVPILNLSWVSCYPESIVSGFIHFLLLDECLKETSVNSLKTPSYLPPKTNFQFHLIVWDNWMNNITSNWILWPQGNLCIVDDIVIVDFMTYKQNFLSSYRGYIKSFRILYHFISSDLGLIRHTDNLLYSLILYTLRMVAECNQNI
jgi:hypothetical protein